MTSILNNINAAPPVPAYVPKTPAAQQQWIAQEVQKAEIERGLTKDTKKKPTFLEIVGGVGNALTNLLGAKTAIQNPSVIYQQPTEKKDYTIWIVLAVVAVVIVAAILLLKNKK